jgi:hypothetical protein
VNKKELNKLYLQSIQPMGILQIRNLSNNKIFLDSGLNIKGKINSSKFQLSNGIHMNKELQEDYNKSGMDNFSFEVLDYLKPDDNIKKDYSKDLKILKTRWIKKLRPFNEKGYHKKKKLFF